MLQRIGRLGLVILFVGVSFAAGIGSTPAHASPSDDAYIRSLVHGTGIDHVTSLVHSALDYGGGSSYLHHDTVYNALGRTTAALDELYTSGATGDVFNTAERLLLTQQGLLHELERFTLSGDLTDLSTVTPLLVDVAQARVAFERQSDFGYSSYLPSRSLGLSSGLLHDRSLSSRRFSSRSLSTLRYSFPSRSLSTLRYSYPSRSFSSGLHRSGRTFLDLRRDRLFDPFGYRDLGSYGLSRFYR